ncbi:uncharacterized protein LOC128746133 [Sabethes cyaneus]|uniref:uncharacterized protein LOC128746133 n=1 Tax=Sabethes cyaneus TaxID=53552 RepID=UPI00237E0BD6|nr:uncharacterized protein LOC128746133 [Sabethes cyaneus]
MSDVPRDAPSGPRATSESEFLDLIMTPCGICGPSTCDEEMIGCDGCAKWFHSRCVGVTEDSVPEKWYCHSKACQQEYQKQQKDSQRQTRGKKTAEESDKPSDTVRKGTSGIEQRMKELEEKRKRQDKELEAEMQLQQMERRMQRDFERKKLEMEIRLRDEEEEEWRALHEEISEKCMPSLEEILQKKRMQIERMKASQRSFEQQVADLDRELKELSVIKNPKVAAKQSQRVFPSESKTEALKQDQANANMLARKRHTEGDFDDDEYDEDSECSQHTNPFSGKNSPQNCTQLVAKIPDREKREWVRFQRRSAGGEPTLRTLTDFLMEIVDDACDANVDVQDTRYQSASAPQPRRETLNERGVLLSHSEACSSGDILTEQRELKPCKVCQSTGHRLRHCDRFGRMPYSERLRMVTREKLYNVCLNEHGGQCKFRIRCNIGDCRERHNPLMHPVESTVGMSAHIRCDSTVIFRIVPVQLYCGEKMVTVLAFLDEGASVTLVEKRLADRLGVVSVQEGLTLKWTANVRREEKDSRRMNVWASVVGDGANKLLLHDVRTVGKLMLPRQKLDKEKLTAQYAYMRELPMESEVNKAVFISKDRRESDEDSDVSSLASTNFTLKPDAGVFPDDCNSDTSTSTTVAQIIPKRRERDPNAFDKWLKAKIETERTWKEKEQKRKRREEARKKLEEERRKQESEEKLKKWMKRKEQERKKKEEIQQKQKQKKEAEQSVSRNWTNSDDSVTNFNVWLSRVKQQENLKKMRQLAKQRMEEEFKHQRQDLSRLFYDEWLKSAKDKPKPVTLNRGVESLRGRISKIFINPNPWQATAE